jgi:hypothetical protein
MIVAALSLSLYIYMCIYIYIYRTCLDLLEVLSWNIPLPTEENSASTTVFRARLERSFTRVRVWSVTAAPTCKVTRTNKGLAWKPACCKLVLIQKQSVFPAWTCIFFLSVLRSNEKWRTTRLNSLTVLYSLMALPDTTTYERYGKFLHQLKQGCPNSNTEFPCYTIFTYTKGRI